MKPKGLVEAVLRATLGITGQHAYRLAFTASAEAYAVDPPAGWDYLTPAARVAMIEGSARTALEALGRS